MSRSVDEFLLWCAAQGIEIDERLDLRVSPVDSSLSVFTKPDAYIDFGESLVRIPKSAVFSTRSCSWSRDIPAHDSDPSLTLSLALLAEILSGPRSRWYGYLNSLPSDVVDLAVFWGVFGDPDGIEAREWIRGTELHKLLGGADGRSLLDRINVYFEQTAKPVLQRLNMRSSLEEFYRAYSLVSSRAFLVDAYHGLSLVPVADAFNHTEDNHVHLESDYHVCLTCGSLAECVHDADSSTGGQEPSGTHVDTCEMVSKSPVGPGAEVFNSYEAGLTNAELLCQYGFALDVNENNVVTWVAEELLKDHPRRETLVGEWSALITQWPRHDGWDASQLVYNPEADESDEDGVPKPLRPPSSLLILNADGQISHHLWLMLAVLGLPDVSVDRALKLVRHVAVVQEQGADMDVTISGGSWAVEGDRLLRTIAAAAVRICETKIGAAHGSDKGQTAIGDLLDYTPARRPLTRRALGYVLEERQLLEMCRGAWLEIAERSSPGRSLAGHNYLDE